MRFVLITGGAGYVGSHAVYAFRAAGYGVVVIDDLSTGVSECLPPDVPFFHADISDRLVVKEILSQYPVCGVLHCAGSVVVPDSVVNPVAYYRNNSAKGLELLEVLVAGGVKYILYSSTAAVYGVPKTIPVVETAPLLPINPYGWSKLFFEQELRDVSVAHGVVYGILRYFNVAGADPQKRTGQHSTKKTTHLIKVACEAAVGCRENVNIFGTDYPTRDGTCVRDYVHVSDLAQAHVAVFESLMETGQSVTFNFGSGVGFSVREVLSEVEKVLGRPLDVSVQGRRLGDPPSLVADPGLLFKSLSWRPAYNLTDVIQTALEWEKLSA